MLLQGKLKGPTKHQIIPSLLLSRLEKLSSRITYEGFFLKNVGEEMFDNDQDSGHHNFVFFRSKLRRP